VEFIRDIRLRRAAQLLKDGTMRTSEVATRVGINDIKYFRKVFQQRYRETPTEYARKFHPQSNDSVDSHIINSSSS
jgi:transcriptional regulator GlxA family with amidase domain